MAQFTAAQILALLPHAFLVLDQDGAIQDVNRAACQLLKKDHHVLTGQPVVDLLDPASKEHLRQTFDEVLARRKKVHVGEVYLNGCDEHGAPVLVEYTVSALPDTMPLVVVLGLRRLHAPGESSPDAALVHEELVDSYHNLVHLNQQLTHKHHTLDLLYQLTHQLNRSLELEEVLTNTLHGMIAMFGAEAGYLVLLNEDKIPVQWMSSDATLTLSVSRLEEAFQAGLERQSFQEHTLLRISDLTTHMPASSPLLPGRAFLVIPLATTTGLLGVLTLVHQTAGAFDVHQDPIVSAAADTAALALQNARTYTQLRDADAARERMNRLLVHDIRGPLSATAASLNVVQRVLADLSLDPEAWSIVEGAIEAGKEGISHVDDLTKDLLEITRLRSGKQTLEPAPLKLQEVYSELTRLMHSSVLENGIHFTSHISPPDLIVTGDRRLIKRMLLNLLNNALRFTPQDGSIALEATAIGDGSEVLMVVEDTGPGVPSEERERIFFTFVQGKGQKNRGTGLGLSLCREVALAHYGRIWVEERPGGGSRFCVHIPVDRLQEKPAQFSGESENTTERLERGG